MRCCRRCGVAGSERVPPAPLGWYFRYTICFYISFLMKPFGLKTIFKFAVKFISFVIFSFNQFVTFCFHIPHVIECSTCVRPSVRSSYCRLEFKLMSFPSACTVFKLPKVLCRGKCLNFIAFFIMLCIENTSLSAPGALTKGSIHKKNVPNCGKSP